MRKINLNVFRIFTLEYDENSPEFKEALESYKEVIFSKGNINDLLKYCVHNINRANVWDISSYLIEGVGFVNEKDKPKPDGWCGITVEESDPDYEIEEVF